MDFIDDDENIKDMRAVAKSVGLTALLVRAHASKQGSEVKDLIRQALRLLGVTDEEVRRERPNAPRK